MKPSKKTAHCPHCSRDNVPITSKGWIAPHVNMAGTRCLYIVQASASTKTPPKRIKPIFNKRPNRVRK